MSCGPGCRTCVPARLTCAASSMPWTPSSPIRRPTSNSPMTWKDSSPSCEPAPAAPTSQSASASCGSSSKTSLSDRRRSPSGTASPSASEPATATATRNTHLTRRVTNRPVAHCVGGVVSPVLSNIYLDRLDTYIEQTLLPAHNRGARRTPYRPYMRLWQRAFRLERQGEREAGHALRKQMQAMPSRDPDDPGYRRLRYCRYADDWLLG